MPTGALDPPTGRCCQGIRPWGGSRDELARVLERHRGRERRNVEREGQDECRGARESRETPAAAGAGFVASRVGPGRRFRVRARRSVEGPVQDANEEFGFPPASVEAEGELVQIALEMLRADAVEGPSKPGLQVPEDPVGPRLASEPGVGAPSNSPRRGIESGTPRAGGANRIGGGASSDTAPRRASSSAGAGAGTRRA